MLYSLFNSLITKFINGLEHSLLDELLSIDFLFLLSKATVEENSTLSLN